MNRCGVGARELAFLVLAVAPACGGGGSGIADDGDPVSRVEHELAGAPELELDLLRVLGRDDGLLQGGFGAVREVVLGPDLAIFVRDPGRRKILRFEPDLDSVSRFPPQGEGPGEVDFITSFGIAGDSLLLVGEATARRVHYFTLQGSFVEVVPGWTSRTFEPDGAPGVRIVAETPVVVLPDGSAITRPWTFWPGELAEAGAFSFPVVAVRHRPGEEESQQVIAEAWMEILPPVTRMYRGIPVQLGHPAAPQAFLVVMPDASGVVSAEPVSARPGRTHREQEVEVVLRSVDGDVLFRRTLCALKPRLEGWRLAAALERPLRYVEQRATAHLAEPPTAADVRQELRSAGYLESLRGPVLDLAGTQNGGIWVALDGGSEHEVPWILLDHSGRTAAWALLSRREQVKAAREDRLLTAHEDELGVETLRVYRVLNSPLLDDGRLREATRREEPRGGRCS